MTKKILSMLFVLMLGASVFAGCSKKAPPVAEAPVTQPTTQIVADTTSFKISYTQSDSLNPYESDTMNNTVAQDLVYEPLFRPDESLDVQPEIASSYSYPDANIVDITLVSGLKFSNGDPLNASAVVTAFENAKKSPLWGSSLAPISSAQALSDTAVRFNLSYKNEYAHQLLTFPIAKTVEGEKYALGSGRYMFTEGDGNVYAELNENYKEDFNPRFVRIQLVNIPSTDSINNALNIGNISYAYRAPGADDISSLKCNKKRVNQNNLVYIGMNSASGAGSNENIRKAVSLAVDRDTLVKSAYQGCAKSASSIYHPSSKLGRETQMFSTKADTAGAKQAIAKSGYSNPTLTLLVNGNKLRVAAARLVKQQLEAVGFSINVRQLDEEAYLSALSSGSYDLYIGETKIPGDMRLSGFFSDSGATAYGIDQKSSCATAYGEYINGDREIGGFTLEFSNCMPFAPLVYRDGIICYSKAIHGNIQGCYGDFFSNIEDWYYN